jgi:hypothetical protein
MVLTSYFFFDRGSWGYYFSCSQCFSIRPPLSSPMNTRPLSIPGAGGGGGGDTPGMRTSSSVRPSAAYPRLHGQICHPPSHQVGYGRRGYYYFCLLLVHVQKIRHPQFSLPRLDRIAHCAWLKTQRLLLFWRWGLSIHGSSLKGFFFSGLLLFDFDAWVLMARASKIIIILI